MSYSYIFYGCIILIGKGFVAKYNNNGCELSENESAFLKKYLLKFITIHPGYTKDALRHIVEINHKKFNQNKLKSAIYDSLINYCILNLKYNQPKDLEMFYNFLTRVNINKFIYGFGYSSFEKRDPHKIFKLTPLEAAIYLNNDNANAFAYILVQAGFGSKFLDPNGLTAVYMAAVAKNIKFLEMIKDLPDVDFNAKSANGLTPLCVIFGSASSSFEYAEVTKKLIECSADINYVGLGDPNNSPGNTILHILVEKCHLRLLAKFTMDYGADLSLKDGVGNTLAHHAIIHNEPRALKFLLDKGYGATDYNENQGYTTLDLLISKGMYEYIGRVIDAGANVNARSLEGTSLLDRAIVFLPLSNEGDADQHKKFLKIIKILFDKGYIFTDSDWHSIITLVNFGHSDIVYDILQVQRSSLLAEIIAIKDERQQLDYSDQETLAMNLESPVLGADSDDFD